MLLDKLRNWGCDVDGALERFVGDEDLYKMCLNTVLEDKAFAGLGETLRASQTKEAFDHAHTLKGVLANMGLTPMFDITVRIVEPLRTGDTDGLLSIYEELLESKELLARMVADVD